MNTKTLETAEFIGNGACNPLPIAKEAHNAIKEAFEATRNNTPEFIQTSEEWLPARIIVGQLAYLLGLSIGASTDDYEALIKLREKEKGNPLSLKGRKKAKQ